MLSIYRRRRRLILGVNAVLVCLIILQQLYLDKVHRSEHQDISRRMIDVPSPTDRVYNDTLYIHEEFRGPKPRLNKRQSSLSSSIFCLVLTTHKNIYTKAKAVNDTWGMRCNKTLFFSNQLVPISNVVYLDNVHDGRHHLTEKVVKSFVHVYNHFRGYDWYLKADDDTYVILDNLRLLLSYFKSREPVYLGQNFKYFTRQGYHSGGAGYVISSNALDKLLNGINTGNCSIDGNDEDVDIGRCLDSQGVIAYDTTDRFNSETFHGGTMKDHVVGPLSRLLQYYPTTLAKTGFDCCSSLTISFHYVPPSLMYIVDMLLYHLTVFGRDYSNNDVFESNSTIK